MKRPRTFPSPVDFGLPARYTEYRPEQVDAVCAIIDSRSDTDVILMPTGGGKSLIPPTIAAAEQCRVLVLTMTKALQDLYHKALNGHPFDPVACSRGCGDLADVRGANAYPCPALQDGGQYDYLLARGERATCDRGPCLTGMPCRLKDGGCPRFDAIRTAARAEVVVTSYSLWLSHGRMLMTGRSEREQLGEFDYLFCDEGHEASDRVTDAMSIDITPADVWEINPMFQPPVDSTAIRQWREWAGEVLPLLGDAVDRIETDMKIARMAGHVSRHLLDYRTKLTRVWTAVQEISDIEGRWVVQQPFGTHDIQLVPVWSSDYTDDLLFRGINKRVLMSATIRPAEMKYVGLSLDQFTFHEYPSSFPVTNRPVYQMPVVRVHHKMTSSEERILLAAMDNLLRTRHDRNSIVHTVSYKRARWAVRSSRYQHRLLQHTPQGTARAVEQFKRAVPGTALVSPAVTTGYDFPMSECEMVVHLKVPYPDPTSELMRVRTETDPFYRHVYAAKQIVQGSGRHVRSKVDRGETFVLDSTLAAFTSSKAKPEMRELLPLWFRQAIRYTTDVPKPLRKL